MAILARHVHSAYPKIAPWLILNKTAWLINLEELAPQLLIFPTPVPKDFVQTGVLILVPIFVEISLLLARIVVGIQIAKVDYNALAISRLIFFILAKNHLLVVQIVLTHLFPITILVGNQAPATSVILENVLKNSVLRMVEAVIPLMLVNRSNAIHQIMPTNAGTIPLCNLGKHATPLLIVMVIVLDPTGITPATA